MMFAIAALQTGPKTDRRLLASKFLSTTPSLCTHIGLLAQEHLIPVRKQKQVDLLDFEQPGLQQDPAVSNKPPGNCFLPMLNSVQENCPIMG